jgi:hypothetical protein
MKCNRRWILLCAVLTSLWSNAAFAEAFHIPPWTGTAVEARIGGNLGGTWLIWRRISDGLCATPVLLGTVAGLFESTTITASNLSDTMIVQSTNGTFCGHPITFPLSNGNTLTLRGSLSNDVILGFAHQNVVVQGDSGNDVIVVDQPFSQVWGGNGADDVNAWSTGAGERVIGDDNLLTNGDAGDGNDCLYDHSHAADIVICGGGFDSQFGSLGFVAGAPCEQVVSCCGFAHLLGAC